MTQPEIPNRSFCVVGRRRLGWGEYLGESRIIWDHQGGTFGISDRLGSYGFIWDHLVSSGIIWDQLESSGRTLASAWGGVWVLGNLWEVFGKTMGRGRWQLQAVQGLQRNPWGVSKK